METILAKSPFHSRAGEARPHTSGGSVKITDLSLQPRIGFKGNGTKDWLRSKIDGALPDHANQATSQPDGALVAWLGGEEYLILVDHAGGGDLTARLEQAWQADHAASKAAIGYPLPRADSHSWLRISGEDVPAMMAKICGVDLRPSVFAEGEIAQTVVARIGAILIREDRGGEYCLHMLTDFAFAHYLWEVLQDAADEFNGGFV